MPLNVVSRYPKSPNPTTLGFDQFAWKVWQPRGPDLDDDNPQGQTKVVKYEPNRIFNAGLSRRAEVKIKGNKLSFTTWITRNCQNDDPRLSLVV